MAEFVAKGALTRKQVLACQRWIESQKMFAAAFAASDKAQADPDLPEIDMMDADLLGGPGVKCPRCGEEEYPVGRALLDGYGSFSIDMPFGLELDNEEGDPHGITWETGCCQLPIRPVFVQHTMCRIHGLASSVAGYPNQCSICNQDGAIRPVYKEE